MRMSWRRSALMLLLLAVCPQAGCVQLPTLGTTQPPAPPTPVRTVPTQPTPQHLSARWADEPLEVRAAALEKEGRVAEAIVVYEQMRQLGGDTLFATRRLAVLHDVANNVDRAQQEYEGLLAHYKQHNIKDAELLYHAGDFYYRRGHWGTAERLLSDAVYYHEKGYGRLSPANEPEARYKWGMSLAHLGTRNERAYVQSLEVLTPVVGSEAEAYCHVAFVMNLQGKRDDAARAYQTALAKQPNMPRALAALAQMQVDPTPQPGGRIVEKTLPPGRGRVELEEGPFAPPVADLGMNRLMSQRPTLPPLPEIDLTLQPGTSAKKAAN